MTSIEKPKQANIQFWAQFATSVAAVLAAIAGLNIEGFSWLLYFCLPLLLISTIAAISQSSIWSYLSKKQALRRDEREVQRKSQEYVKLATDIANIEQLINKVSNDFEWGAVQRPRSPQLITDRYWFEMLGKEKKVYSIKELEFLNHIIGLYISGVECYLQDVDSLVISGQIGYKYHSHKAEVVQHLSKLYLYRDEHNKFCSNLNENVSTFKLKNVYG
ncbi:hypothetical protein [Vibrio parahaemolyticus]|uniref:hypothetical protein n=1 Tax=Vibrio parahaemolyticus TaxID=670 RepID=UPI0018A19D3D|nr:hypothetical protein [Vibrio parahaemolyticus]